MPPCDGSANSAGSGGDHEAEADEGGARGPFERAAEAWPVEDRPGLGQEERAAAQPDEGEGAVRRG